MEHPKRCKEEEVGELRRVRRVCTWQRLTGSSYSHAAPNHSSSALRHTFNFHFFICSWVRKIYTRDLSQQLQQLLIVWHYCGYNGNIWPAIASSVRIYLPIHNWLGGMITIVIEAHAAWVLYVTYVVSYGPYGYIQNHINLHLAWYTADNTETSEMQFVWEAYVDTAPRPWAGSEYIGSRSHCATPIARYRRHEWGFVRSNRSRIIHYKVGVLRRGQPDMKMCILLLMD